MVPIYSICYPYRIRDINLFNINLNLKFKWRQQYKTITEK